MVKVYYWFVIYKVRSGWVVADLFLSFFQLDGTFWVQEVEVYNMAANKTWYSLAEALEEHQLAHAVKDPNGRAYNRTKHLSQRQGMMQAWADYLDGLRRDKTIKSISGQTR